MLNKIVIASKNEGKIAEFGRLLEPLGIEAVPYAGPDVAETGRTFEENARLKAEAACRESGLPAIGDDSGIALRALGGFPGLKSQRFAEESGGYPKAFERIESMLKGKDRDAYFACAIALASPGEKTRAFEGRINGFIAHPPRGANGFGYDPVFVANGTGRTFAEMPDDEKSAISHRGAAFAKLRAYLESLPKMEAVQSGAESKPAAPKRRPAKKAEAAKTESAPADEWGEVAKEVRKLKPRERRPSKAKAEECAKAEEFEIEVEAIEAVKEND
jgi:XTP/dITP diphosphohydrolase